MLLGFTEAKSPREVPRSSLHVLDELGAGAFGKVFKVSVSVEGRERERER